MTEITVILMEHKHTGEQPRPLGFEDTQEAVRYTKRIELIGYEWEAHVVRVVPQGQGEMEGQS
jgi:hypothetical protein